MIQLTEKELGIVLPSYYKDTLENYPFPIDSFANECLLPLDISFLIQDNLEYISNNKLIVGGDGGEELYLIKINSSLSEVYVFDFEIGDITKVHENWKEFLETIHKTLAEIEEDEKYQENRKANKKWWQFWI